MKNKLIILFVFLSFSGISQVKLDSLWKVWNDSNQSDTNRLKAIKEISWSGYLYSNPDSTILLAKMGYDFAKTKNLRIYEGIALNTIGVAYCVKGEFPKAIEYDIQSMQLREEIGDKNGVASSLNNLGLIYKEQGIFAKAIEYFTKSLKIKEEVGDKTGEASIVNNIGVIYQEQNDNDKALYYYNRSFKTNTEIGNKKGITTALNNIGTIYQTMGDSVKALDYHNRSYKVSEDNGDKNGMAMALDNIGGLYKSRGDYKKALEIIFKCLKIDEEINNRSGLCSAFSNIAEIYQLQGDYKNSIEFGKRALDIAEKTGSIIDLKDPAETLYKSYEKTGDYKNALEMHELFIKTKDSIQSEKNHKEIIKQELQYNYEKQKAVDEKEHEKQMAVASELEKKQRVISYSIAFGLIMVLIFALFVFNRLQLTKKQKFVIEHQKDLVEEKQKEILDSITYAKRLQEAILPPDSFVKQHLPESFIFYKPKDIVAGDFYWMEIYSRESGERRTEKKNNNSNLNNPILETEKTQCNQELENSELQTPDSQLLFIAAADCTGPGAIVSVVCSNALNRAVLEFGISEPGKILDKTRELVLETFSRSDKDVKDGMDISLCSINQKTKEIKWAGANNSLWYIANKEVKEIKADKQAIGKTEKPQPFTTHTIQLQKGDSLFLFTDGYADQFGGEKGKKIKSKPLKEMLTGNSNLPLTEQKEKLEIAFEKWKGNIEQVDDVCIIGVRL